MRNIDEGVAEIEGGAISWEAAGEGAAVTFLHRGLWDRRTWDEQFASFAERYRVVRYDARGYGRSRRPEPGRPYSHVHDLMAVLDAAGVDGTALVVPVALPHDEPRRAAHDLSRERDAEQRNRVTLGRSETRHRRRVRHIGGRVHREPFGARVA